MPKIRYTSGRFKGPALSIINQANAIIGEYTAKGFQLTLRQLYYQFVARGTLGNTEKNYKKLGAIVSEARMAGLIDWSAIGDRTRFLRKLATWDNPQEILATCANQFRIDKWANQPAYVEVFIEKDALIGVIEDVCDELEVPYLACRGYASASEIWNAGRNRFRPKIGKKQCVILYLGDHDPSGLDMSRDVRERVSLFAGGPVTVKRLALNMDQVEEFTPPPNPTKTTDSRSSWYIEMYGHECWELDALDPEVIAGLIRDAVAEILDQKVWEDDRETESGHKHDLATVADLWDSIVKTLHKPEKGA